MGARFADLLFERLIRHRSARVAREDSVRWQQFVAVQREQRRVRLLLRQIARRPDHNL